MNTYSAALRTRNVLSTNRNLGAAVFGRGAIHPMRRIYHLILGGLAFLWAGTMPVGAQDSQWDFVFDANKLPQTIIDEGGVDWQPIEGETNGQSAYESIVEDDEAQVGNVWVRLDDNSTPDPNASTWARGYFFGTDVYSEWAGKMTLVMRIKDLGTDSQKSVMDLQTVDADQELQFYWTLGHVAEDSTGPAGWEFGQTDDGRNSNGLSDVRTDNHNQWVIIRINVIDEQPGDNFSRIQAWQNGNLVYDAQRSDDIAGKFGAIGFRRTSNGREQKMAIDWIRMDFDDAYAPDEGPLTPNGGSDSPGWNFVYNGDTLPQTLIDEGRTDWEPRPDEIDGRPSYESIDPVLFEAQVGGTWLRQDDNSINPDVDPSDSEPWARGYRFGTDIYDRWNGRMTLVMRIKDLGTNSQKSVLDITNSSGNYWTLGHVAQSVEGEAGWEFGQTNDGRNGNGSESDFPEGSNGDDVRTDASGEFVVIRIVIIDDIPGDGQSVIKGYQNGELVYQSTRTDDISVGEFGEIAFRRTSGGSEQHMEIDWVVMKFGAAWEPGMGAETPAGLHDGFFAEQSGSKVETSKYVNGALGLDTFGAIRAARSPSVGAGVNELFAVDENGVPTQYNFFYFGFDVYRDLETVANEKDQLTGIMALDKFAGVHTYTVTGPGIIATGPGVPISSPAMGPPVDFTQGLGDYNAAHSDTPVTLPFFTRAAPDGGSIPLDLDFLGMTDMAGGDNAIAKDIEVAVDWRPATNAFQGYYILDVFGGIHYVNNAEILGMMNQPDNLAATNRVVTSDGEIVVEEPVGFQKFFDIFKFKPRYLVDYVGENPDDDALQRSPAPYVANFPFARDLEVMVRYEQVTQPTINDSILRQQTAIDEGINVNNIFQPIAMDVDRLDVSSPKFAESVAITNGYAILDGFGAVHSLLEDEDGEPIPALWENPVDGRMDPSVDAPYFFRELAIDLEMMPNGGGYCLLTRLGQVFVVNGRGKTIDDNFVDPKILLKLPIFGFDAARDLVLVPNEEGQILGMYVVDRFGTVHRAGNVPRLPGDVLFFSNGFAHDLELSPYGRPISPPAVVTSPEGN